MLLLISEWSFRVDVDSSEEDLETAGVQEGAVQRDPRPQVHHHSDGTRSRPHRCCLRIRLLYS